MRYLEHTLTLPNSSSNTDVFVEANLTAHIEAAWSNAALTMVLEDENGQEYDVFRLEQDYWSNTREVSANPRANVSEFAGQEVTVSFRADGRWTYESSDTLTWMEVDNVTIESANTTIDSDGDGVPDGEEVDMDTYLGDQDLSDADVIHFPGYAWSSDPLSSDSDGDGLVDDQEERGWNISVVETPDGDPYRWAPTEAVQNGTIRVYSDPQEPDSDRDGLSDAEEIEETHTDPEATTTYEITNEHEEYFGRFANTAEVSTIFSASSTSASMTQETELNDGSDDFDFVMLESDESSGLDRVSFRAIDGTRRSDVWFNNEDEVTYETDPWDPDTDDDGLTDGWEVEGIITYPPNGFEQSYRFDDSTTLNISYAGTSPSNPDSHYDGYWDGWIGVHGVGYTDNVVLYREHLQSGDGIEDDEIVNEQVGYHEVTSGVDIDNDGTNEHSNIHIGERHWQEVDDSESGDLLDPEVTPAPSVTFEVDYYHTVSAEMRLELNNVEDIYSLYGINISYIQNEEISQSDIENEFSQPVSVGGIPEVPHGFTDVQSIEPHYHNNESRVYLFLSPAGASGIGAQDWSNIGGVASSAGEGFLPTWRFGTVAHETGHVLGIGRNDDETSAGFTDEVYSGIYLVTRQKKISICTILTMIPLLNIAIGI